MNNEVRTFPFPNIFIDEYIPTLKDTELRVLMVVWRSTKGWRDEQGRTKARDWISSSQMQKRTGRSSEAVSGAIASLVTKGLIVVEDASGRKLNSADERRRHLGKLYYRAGDLWKTAEPLHPSKSKRTKDKLYK